MARGMVVGEPVVSQANSKAYAEGYERIFGRDHKAQRGTWVAHPETGEAIPVDEYVPPPSKAGTTIVSGRWHEGEKAPDGTDIGTPARRRAWMKATGNADYDDFKGAREKRAKQEAETRRLLETGKVEKHDPKLRDFIGRELYKRKMIL